MNSERTLKNTEKETKKNEKWLHEDENNITYFRYTNETQAEPRLIIQAQHNSEVSKKIQLRKILLDAEKFISSNKLNAKKNLCCDQKCEDNHYWYIIDNVKIRTPYNSYEPNVDLIKSSSEILS